MFRSSGRSMSACARAAVLSNSGPSCPRTPLVRSAANEVPPEHLLLFDEGGAVRGAYALVFQRFLIGGVPEAAAFLQIPISEGR